MRLDEGFDGNFFYGPSLSLDREPFVNERYLFRDRQYHNCEPYFVMEEEFFSVNAAIVREVFFDADSLLGVDSEKDVGVEDAVEYEDLVPEILSEENQLRHAAVREILEMKIVRMSPVNSDSEDEETTGRVMSPMVVETISDLAEASVATGSTDNDVNNQLNLVIAAEAGCVENVVKGRVKLPSDPGPFSEDVSLGDFVRGFVPFLAFSDWVGGEVSLYFFPFLSVVYILFLYSGA
jgi:hypothetical protein